MTVRLPARWPAAHGRWAKSGCLPRLQACLDLITITPTATAKRAQEGYLAMHRSTDRILTTHVGSLIRPDSIRKHLRAKQKGEGYDAVAVSCFADPGLELARSLVDIPVVSSCETALLVASTTR